MSTSYANELVLSQLSFQLPQNSGARGKGNWPLEMGQLQSLVGCLISWRCDMTSRRASKSKSGVRKERAKLVVGRFTPATARFTRRFEKERHAGFDLARAGAGCNSYSYLLKLALARTFRSRLAEASTLHAEAGWTRQECFVGLAAILAPTYRHTQRRTWRKKNPNREIVIAL
jgi:hypothetical protein